MAPSSMRTGVAFSRRGFAVGSSLDGPQEMHDSHRLTKGRKPTHSQAMRGYELLRKHQISCDVLCVVHGQNVHHFYRGLPVL